jgi:hypothetical protein
MDYFRSTQGPNLIQEVINDMKISEKNKNNAISIERKPKLQLLEPGSTPQRFRGDEDQPRQHNIARRENNNLADRAVCAALPWLGKDLCGMR